MEILKFAETFLTASSLAMDALSVSICIGLAHTHLSRREAFVLGCAFGGFQFFMPLIGGLVANGIVGFFSVWTPWIAAVLLIYVGGNMIKEALSEDGEEDNQIAGEDGFIKQNVAQASCNVCRADRTKQSRMAMTFRNVLMLALATSIDAMIVGFSVEGTGGGAFMLAVMAGIVTFVLSVVGALLGKELGEKFGRKAEIAGGVVLLTIAVLVIKDAV